MLTLYTFGPVWGMPDASPFCVKLDCWLRMSGIDAERQQGYQHLKRAPKGKMPFIRLGDELIGDSEYIIEALTQRYGDTLDGALTPEQRALARLVQRTLDEHCYFALVYSRWLDPHNWPITQASYFKPVPALLRGFIAGRLQRQVRKTLLAQGIARHSRAQIYASAIADLEAALRLLGDKDYLFGAAPCSADAVLWSYLVSSSAAPLQSPVADYLKSQPQAQAYIERIYARYFPEFRR